MSESETMEAELTELQATWGKRSRRIRVAPKTYAHLLAKADDLLVRVQRFARQADGTYLSRSGCTARIEPRIDFTHWRLSPRRSHSLVVHYR